MTNHIVEAHMAVVSTAIGLHQLGQWLYAHGDELSLPALAFVGALMVSVARYCNITMVICQAPNAEAPVMGRRCIFY